MTKDTGQSNKTKSLLSSAEVKNAWSYNSIPAYAFMVWFLIK